MAQMNKISVAIAFLLSSFLWLPVHGQLAIDEGFETVTDLNPPNDDGMILSTGWQGALRSTPEGFTGVFQGVPPDGMGGGGGFGAHLGPDNSFMAVAFTSAGSFTVNDVISTWMLSPPIMIAEGDVLSFYTRTASFSAFPDRLDLRLSTNGDSTNVGNGAFSVGDFSTTLMTINPNLMMGEFPGEWTKFEHEFTGISEPFMGRFAFHYFIEDLSSNGNGVGIDTVTFSGAGADCLLGDANMDGVVDLLDVGLFVDILVMGGFQCESDVNQDGIVDLLDVGPFVDVLLGN